MTIGQFRGRWRFLSNFWPATVYFGVEAYSTVEHAYQAAKTVDPLGQKQIREAMTPGQAKKLGKLVTMRPGWDDVKLVIMERLLRQKFADATLWQQLVDTTGCELIEGNSWGDTYWGQCVTARVKITLASC